VSIIVNIIALYSQLLYIQNDFYLFLPFVSLFVYIASIFQLYIIIVAYSCPLNVSLEDIGVVLVNKMIRHKIQNLLKIKFISIKI
jgi:hypothetical protein